MTAWISHIRSRWIRQPLWLLWFPLGVYLDLWWKFRNNRSFDALVWAAWDLGWKGIDNERK